MAIRATSLGLAVAALAGCQNVLVLDPRGPVAAAERTILIDSLAIMLAIVLPTIAATLAFAWWWRGSNRRARYLGDWAFSGPIELVVWFIPLLTILLLGGVTWIGSHQLDPARPLPGKVAPLEVEVVSLDWKWLFIYPAQGVATVNELVLPAGRPVHFSLTSASVMNTFFVPQLGSMIYTMNGMATELHLQADRPGEYLGLSGHFSGDGFSDMHFTARALEAGGFERWVAEAKGGRERLSAERYRALAEQSRRDPPATFAAVEPGLFAHIVSQHLPPAPGPDTRGEAQELTPAGR